MAGWHHGLNGRLSELQEMVMDRDAWSASIHGVAKIWTRLKQLNSNNNSNGEFHAKMGTIKDRNGMDLTEAEDRIHRRTKQKRSS